jgi:ATP/maltotriose-dependent transcriptional regulator MalT
VIEAKPVSAALTFLLEHLPPQLHLVIATREDPDLPLAQGDPSAALTALASRRQQVEARGWQDERLKLLVLQAIAHYVRGDADKALALLDESLALAEPGSFIRLFVDEGAPMAL